MTNAIKLGFYFALIALAWVANSLLMASLSVWLIEYNHQTLLRIVMILSYAILAFIIGILVAHCLAVIRDIFRS